MKKFIWNWKFKYSLFNKKEKRIVPIFLLSMLIVSISTISAMIPKYYAIEFYDQNEQELFVHEFKEGTRINLNDYKPDDPEEVFYGWALKKDSTRIRTRIPKIDQDFRLYAIWGRYEERVIDEELDYAEIKKEDDSILKGKEKIQEKGEKGLKQLTYQEFIVGDKVIDRKLLEDKLIKEPKDKIVFVGTKEEQIAKASPKVEPKKKTTEVSSRKETKKQEDSPQRKNEKPIANPTPKKKPKPAPKPAAKPKPAPSPAPKENTYEPIYGIEIIPNKFNDKFKNCDQLRTVYPLGVPKGHPAYENYPRGDADKDGWACEVKETPGGFYGNNNSKQ